MTTRTTKKTAFSFLLLLLLAVGTAVSLPACDTGNDGTDIFHGWGK